MLACLFVRLCVFYQFYYFIPRSDLTGTITLDGETYTVEGTGWYDHEFGLAKEKDEVERKAAPTYAWQWLGLQLDDGTDITATTLMEAKKKELYDNFIVTVEADSTREELLDMKFESSNFWSVASSHPFLLPFFLLSSLLFLSLFWFLLFVLVVSLCVVLRCFAVCLFVAVFARFGLVCRTSVRTMQDYPTEWTLISADGKVNLKLVAEFPEQEFITLLASPSFYEARVRATGTYKGKQVTGLGFVERNGFQIVTPPPVTPPLSSSRSLYRLPSSCLAFAGVVALSPSLSRLPLCVVWLVLLAM